MRNETLDLLLDTLPEANSAWQALYPTTAPEARIMRARLQTWVRRHWSAIVAASGCRADAVAWLPKNDIVLLGQSKKTKASDGIGIATRILYLAPADLSGRNVCPWSTAECRSVCLGHSSGHMVRSSVRRSQIWKTALYYGAREVFRALLACELTLHVAAVVRTGKLDLAAVRLDGTSDLGIAACMMEHAAAVGVVLYDYTKSEIRADRYLGTNWNVCLSYTGYNANACRAHLARGGTVAVVFRTSDPAEFPARFLGAPVANGDENDAVFLTPGHVRALTWKGAARGDCSAFTVPVSALPVVR